MDWVGRPIQCARCGSYDAEMSWRAYERFCGKAAIAAWNAEALERMNEARKLAQSLEEIEAGEGLSPDEVRARLGRRPKGSER